MQVEVIKKMIWGNRMVCLFAPSNLEKKSYYFSFIPKLKNDFYSQ
ncbi:hypothetical protein SAMN05444397_102364 [Flavobacterium aquidurense]|nr:hypothetical protein SAMN05444397_102364 [Flavobacterium aquidurense]